jgi:hypothetical protein
MTPREENALAMLRRLVDSERGKHRTKQKAAGTAADKQLPLIVGPEKERERRRSVDRIAVRALLVNWNLQRIGSQNRAQSTNGTGRVAEEVRTPDGTVEKPPRQLNLFEADAVITRKTSQIGGLTFEVEYLRELRDLAAERARDAGLDPERVVVVIGDYVDETEATDIRQRRAA